MKYFNEVTRMLTKLHAKQIARAEKAAKMWPKILSMEVVNFVPLKEAKEKEE